MGIGYKRWVFLVIFKILGPRIFGCSAVLGATDKLWLVIIRNMTTLSFIINYVLFKEHCLRKYVL